MKILGIGNAIVDVLCKVEDQYLIDNGLTKSTMKLVDEIEFKKLLSELNIKMLVLDKKYKDNGPEYNVDSYMWSGVGDHKNSDMFKQKLKEYM